ncbi:hypothetical protein [Halalkalibacter alkalisediminis]|uniref:Uncharacterized protein n=1 Tax=Halalkalibacter alkalisediminis TaxID=935616 RepID=A0ABV6NKD8_9BACI|nr:hypothetical protein [Halalkalibacter alkalisediminis]
MGFWNTVGKIANAGLDKTREMGAEAQDKYDRFDRYYGGYKFASRRQLVQS